MSSSRLHLHVYPGTWGLPSCDPQCLAAIYLLQVLLPGEWLLVPSSESSYGPLPVLRESNGSIVAHGLSGILSYLSPSADLKPSQRADVTALCTYLLSEVSPLVDGVVFGDYATWNTVMKPAYASAEPWPMAMWVPDRMRKRRCMKVEAKGWMPPPSAGSETRDRKPRGRDEMEAQAVWALRGSKEGLSGYKGKENIRYTFKREQYLEKVRMVFRLLDDQLQAAESPFLLGHRKPTAADAILFGLLASPMKAEFGNNLLAQLLQGSFPNLIGNCEATGQALWSPQPASPIPSPARGSGNSSFWRAISEVPSLASYYWNSPASGLPAPEGSSEPVSSPESGKAGVPFYRSSRFFWIASVVLGFVGFIASNVQIEWVEVDENGDPISGKEESAVEGDSREEG